MKEALNDHENDRCTEKQKGRDLVCTTKQTLLVASRAKRRLVTLNEANQAARRLAAWKMGSPRDNTPNQYDGDAGGMYETPQGGDEVQAWLTAASRPVE